MTKHSTSCQSNKYREDLQWHISSPLRWLQFKRWTGSSSKDMERLKSSDRQKSKLQNCPDELVEWPPSLSPWALHHCNYQKYWQMSAMEVVSKSCELKRQVTRICNIHTSAFSVDCHSYDSIHSDQKRVCMSFWLWVLGMCVWKTCDNCFKPVLVGMPVWSGETKCRP